MKRFHGIVADRLYDTLAMVATWAIKILHLDRELAIEYLKGLGGPQISMQHLIGDIDDDGGDIDAVVYAG
ncbi:MAG: hypothetical protein ABR507_04230 [Actinomycetota bacterium]|nr:hypothetical protein [Actinomycetota bacterium]